MASVYLWKCSNCEYEVETSGPWEFYRDKAGRRKQYPRPYINGDDAVEAGVSGLSAKLYCPVCDKVADRIIVEYKVPIKDLTPLAGTPEPMEKYLKTDTINCRTCGNTKMLLGVDNTAEVTCPRCEVGNLNGLLFLTI